jgi:hypothetical protein
MVIRARNLAKMEPCNMSEGEYRHYLKILGKSSHPNLTVFAARAIMNSVPYSMWRRAYYGQLDLAHQVCLPRHLLAYVLPHVLKPDEPRIDRDAYALWKCVMSDLYSDKDCLRTTILRIVSGCWPLSRDTTLPRPLPLGLPLYVHYSFGDDSLCNCAFRRPHWRNY